MVYFNRLKKFNRSGLGTDLEQTWNRLGTDLVWTWYGLGMGMKRIWTLIFVKINKTNSL